jgi:hypothetical protein
MMTPITDRLRAGCKHCIGGLIALEGWKPVEFAWMSYFVYAPCPFCERGAKLCACSLPNQYNSCGCYECSRREYQAQWDKVRDQYTL